VAGGAINSKHISPLLHLSSRQPERPRRPNDSKREQHRQQDGNQNDSDEVARLLAPKNPGEEPTPEDIALWRLVFTAASKDKFAGQVADAMVYGRKGSKEVESAAAHLRASFAKTLENEAYRTAFFSALGIDPDVAWPNE